MVMIPQYGDPTLEAMKRKIKEIGNNKSPRNYLGASLIGNPCSREIWYSYNGFPSEEFEAETILNFEDGHRTEDVTAERLRLVDGITLVTHDENGNQLGFSHLNGKFKGHWDGIISGLKQATRTPHVWECKCCKESKFKEFQRCKIRFGEKLALRNWNENYFAQAQIYMHFTGIDRHYLTVALAGGRDYDSCRTEYEPEIANFYIDRAEKIINSKEPPPKINTNKDFYICKWCKFKDICHNENTKTIPDSGFKSPF